MRHIQSRLDQVEHAMMTNLKNFLKFNNKFLVGVCGLVFFIIFCFWAAGVAVFLKLNRGI
jgi:hypothetical protein